MGAWEKQRCPGPRLGWETFPNTPSGTPAIVLANFYLADLGFPGGVGRWRTGSNSRCSLSTLNQLQVSLGKEFRTQYFVKHPGIFHSSQVYHHRLRLLRDGLAGVCGR